MAGRLLRGQRFKALLKGQQSGVSRGVEENFLKYIILYLQIDGSLIQSLSQPRFSPEKSQKVSSVLE